MRARLIAWWRALVDLGMRPIEIRLASQTERVERVVEGLAERSANREAALVALVRARGEVLDRAMAGLAADLVAVRADVMAVTTSVGELGAQQEADVKAMETSRLRMLDALTESLEAVGARLLASTRETRERLDGVVRLLDGVTVLVGKQEGGMAQLAARMEQVDARFNHLTVMLTGKNASDIAAGNGARSPRTFDLEHRQ